MTTLRNELSIRELLLTVISEREREAQNGGASLQQGTVLRTVHERLGRPHDQAIHEAVLTAWHDLFRTGVLSWGFNLNNTDAPFFHLTATGRRTLGRLNQDPANPAGYMRHLESTAKLNPITRSYMNEALNCFVAGLHKAAAVMVGAAAESIILEMRDIAVARLGTSAPKRLSEWQAKTILTSLHALIDARKKDLPPDLRDEFESYWLAFAQPIRAARNDAGHPTSVEPVTDDAVHASLLVFPQLAKLSASLGQWMEKNLNP